MYEKTVKLEINIPLKASITPEGEVSLGFNEQSAIEAIKEAMVKDEDSLRIFMLSHLKCRRDDEIIQECLNRR